jgi:glyoxalase/bleomycin resistance protein/dioxygenase superfamily protein
VRSDKMKVRLWVIGPFLAYLLVFVIWFPLWQHSPHSLSARAFGILFGAMTAILVALYLVGAFFDPLGLGPVTGIAIKAYETLFGDHLRKAAMPLFYTDSLTLAYSDVEGAKRWWIDAFGCKVVREPSGWDCPLPSDVALQLPGHDAPTILLNAEAEVEQAGYERPSPLGSVIFCEKLKKGHEQLASRGVPVGPIQDGGDTQFFEIRDTEGNVIQVCKEP